MHVPDPVGAQIADIRAAVGDPLGSHIPTHITLLPPTRVTTEQHAALGQHLAEVAARHRAFDVHLSGTDTFRPVSDVVYVALAEGVDECRSLATTVCGGPVASPSPFAYYPHVTLAHDIGPEELDRVQAEQRDFEASLAVEELCLYSMTEAAVSWQLQSRFALQGAG